VDKISLLFKLFTRFFWHSFLSFYVEVSGRGWPGKNGFENILQLPDLDNASVGKKETTGTPVITGVFFIWKNIFMNPFSFLVR
jgi:hypothetical protein